MKNIAVLLTCHNRKEKTINCLKSLYRAIELESDEIKFDVYLVDDGSTDGTDQAVRQRFPNVKVIKGSGDLFWCGGMRLAWAEAAKVNHDAYFWLNDDTILLPDAISTLVNTAMNIHIQKDREGLIVGSCHATNSEKQTYGGRMKKNKDLFVTPGDYPQKCDIINGNIVLVPRSIFEVLGNISSEFMHLGGDNDYGERAIKAGFEVWVAPGYQGVCDSHPYLPWADPTIPLRKRLQILHSPKGQQPYEVYIYARRHNKYFWPMDLIKLYFRVLFPEFHSKIKHIIQP